MTRPGLERRTFLALAGAGTLAGLASCTSSPGPAQTGARPAAVPGKDRTIFDLSFSENGRFRPFHLVSPSFVQATAPAVAAASSITRSDASPQAPFAAVEVEVRGRGGVVVAGLSAASGDRVLATYDGTRVALEVRTGGRTRVLRRRTVSLPESFTLGFALCENQATVLVAERGGPDAGYADWRPLLTERDKVAALVDLRVPETLGALAYTWGVRSGRADLGTVRAGLFGMTGVRDPHLVQHADGRPYVRDGKAFLTFTCAGLGFFQQAHWGVFTLDLADPTRLEQVAQLYTRRDGLLLGDHAGQLVRDDEGERWLVATSSWGDFAFDGVHVRHLTTTDDLLSGVHLLQTERTELPTDVSAWDPGMTLVDGRWHVSFVESPSQDPFDFHPALAVGDASSPWHDGLVLVGAADDLHQCEGPLLTRVGDGWWLLASDGDARNYPVFTLGMTRVGRLDAPYPTNIPHPTLLQLPSGWLMVTFDGTPYAEDVMGYGGHGDVVLMRSR